MHRPPPGASPSGWQRFFAVALLVLAVLAAYWNSLGGPFLFDDLPAIVDNPTIRQLGRLDVVLAPPHDGSGVTGRPLVNLTLALNYAWGGLDPRGYHAANLAIHLLAGLALFGLARRTLRAPVLPERFAGYATPLATVVALLWLVHPLQTESVTFVIQRTESLMGLCYLATLYCFARGTDAHQSTARWLTLSVLCCALGMGAKEVMVTAPVMVLLYDRTFVAGSFRAALARRRWFYVALAATWAPLVWLVAGGGGSRGAAAGLGLGISGWSYALTQCGAIVHYLRLALWPHPLVADYGAGVVSGIGAVWPQALVVMLLVAGTVWALWRRPAAGFCGAWFLVILAPSSSIVPLIGQTVAEHRMYLPLAAVVVGVTLGVFRHLGRAGLGALVALAATCGWLTLQRNAVYGDATTFWRDAVRQAPGNYRAHYNLAVQLAQTPAGRMEAIAEYEQTVRLQPDYADAHNNLGIALAQIPGRSDEAVREYEAALRLRPQLADAHYNLALELGRRPGGAPAAITHYEAALRLRPDFAEAHNNLAIELARIPGRLSEAVDHYASALRLNPDFAEAHYGLGNALAATPGRLVEAVPEYEAALRLRPDYADARLALAGALARLPGRGADSIAQYEELLRRAPDRADAHYNLANELARASGRLAEAVAHYEAAVRLQPDFAEARNNLAYAYARSGRLDDAIAQLAAVLQLHPDDLNARRNLELLRSQRHP